VTTQTGQLKKINLQIAGMTCASCVAHNEEPSRSTRRQESGGQPGHRQASIEYDPTRVTLADMRKAVSDVGYEVVLDRSQLEVRGMTCVNCVANIEKRWRAARRREDSGEPQPRKAQLDTPSTSRPSRDQKTIQQLGYTAARSSTAESLTESGRPPARVRRS